MTFCEQLNKYIEQIECSSQELVNASGLTTSVISRYRRGHRSPNIRSKQLEQLVDGLYKLSIQKELNITREEFYITLSNALNDISIDFEQLSKNFNELITTLNVNMAELSRFSSYDSSLLSKIRTGNRNPSKPKDFIETVCNFIVKKYKSEDDKKTETSDEVPEYLSTYVAPTELGTDPLSYNIEIENQVYTLPAPVSAFTDNGWKIASQEDSVPSGRSLSSAIKLQKDGKEIEASVTNFADYQTKPENCAISTLAFYADDTKNPEVKLPGGITIKSTSDDLKKWDGDKFDYSKSGDSESYSYYEDNGSIDINCKKTINYIRVENEAWPSK